MAGLLKRVRESRVRARYGLTKWWPLPEGGGPPIAELEVQRRAGSLHEFWQRAHSNPTSWWTSGTPFDYIRGVFRLPKDLTNLKALVIGVGQGNELHGFRDAGAIVSGLDIAEAARERFATEFPMYTEETLSGTFDVMVMHLVAQHMSNAQLARLLGTLSPHLSPDGLLHVQFACPLGTEEDEALKTEAAMTLKRGLRTRQILEIIGLADPAFSIADLRFIGAFPEYRMYHLAAALRARSDVQDVRHTPSATK
jgi:hypothetical protein